MRKRAPDEDGMNYEEKSARAKEIDAQLKELEEERQAKLDELREVGDRSIKLREERLNLLSNADQGRMALERRNCTAMRSVYAFLNEEAPDEDGIGDHVILFDNNRVKSGFKLAPLYQDGELVGFRPMFSNMHDIGSGYGMFHIRERAPEDEDVLARVKRLLKRLEGETS